MKIKVTTTIGFRDDIEGPILVASYTHEGRTWVAADVLDDRETSNKILENALRRKWDEVTGGPVEFVWQ